MTRRRERTFFEEKFCRKKEHTEKGSSEGESLMREYLDILYVGEEKIYNYRPDWLKNPATGRNLEYDVYYPRFKRAYEFNGERHFTSKKQSARDWLKKRLSEKADVRVLIIVPLGLRNRIFRLEGNHILKNKIDRYLLRQAKKYPKAATLTEGTTGKTEKDCWKAIRKLRRKPKNNKKQKKYKQPINRTVKFLGETITVARRREIWDLDRVNNKLLKQLKRISFGNLAPKGIDAVPERGRKAN